MNKVNLDELVRIPSLNGRSFSGYLACLETGRIWSCKTDKWIKASPTQDGYMKVGMMDDARKKYQTYVHRIIVAAKMQSWDFNKVEHKNSKPWNNSISNLAALQYISFV